MELFAELLNIPIPALRGPQPATSNLRSYVTDTVIPKMSWLPSVSESPAIRKGLHKNHLSGRYHAA